MKLQKEPNKKAESELKSGSAEQSSIVSLDSYLHYNSLCGLININVYKLMLPTKETIVHSANLTCAFLPLQQNSSSQCSLHYSLVLHSGRKKGVENITVS